MDTIHQPLSLRDTAKSLVAEGKGLLAMDESNLTCDGRFARLGIPQSVETRRAYRELLVTTPLLGACISGAILYDETIRQNREDGTPFVRVLRDAGIIPGPCSSPRWSCGTASSPTCISHSKPCFIGPASP